MCEWGFFNEHLHDLVGILIGIFLKDNLVIYIKRIASYINIKNKDVVRRIMEHA